MSKPNLIILLGFIALVIVLVGIGLTLNYDSLTGGGFLNFQDTLIQKTLNNSIPY